MRLPMQSVGNPSSCINVRYMKGNMSETEFKAWAAQAAVERDTAIEQTKATIDAAIKVQIIERLREELNRK